MRDTIYYKYSERTHDLHKCKCSLKRCEGMPTNEYGLTDKFTYVQIFKNVYVAMTNQSMTSLFESRTAPATITGPHDAMYISIAAYENIVSWAKWESTRIADGC